jgi:hydrogenase maturation factor
MCFAIKGRVISVKGKKAIVDFEGIRKNVNAEFVKIKKGDEVLVFNNIIIERCV